MNNQDYIEKWLEGTMNEDEKRIFEQSEEYKSLEKLSKSLKSFKAPDFDVHTEWQKLQAKKTSRAAGKVVSMRWLKPLLQAAAVLTVMAGSYFFFLQDSPTTIQTAVAERVELFLPDSSFVGLSALSKIEFNKSDWSEKRAVTLKGEAFFKVAKGSRFDVETSSGIVTVLGTEFNVKNRNNYFEVICYEGLVEVHYAQHVVKLPPNQLFRVYDGIVVHTNISPNSPDWRTHESSFQSVSFAQVIEEFERQYNVKVTTKNVKLDQAFTGRFTHSDMLLALKSISFPLNLTYQITGDKKVVLSGETE